MSIDHRALPAAPPRPRAPRQEVWDAMTAAATVAAVFDTAPDGET